MTVAMPLAYAHLNLTRNPFSEVPWADRAELMVADVAPLLVRLARPGFAVQFLADRGRGKTSHLLALCRHFPQAPYVHVGEGERPRLPGGHPFFLDEAQRLPRWRRRLLFRRPVSLAIGSHEDHAGELRAAGFAVETWRPGEATDVERLGAIVARRLEWARRGPGPLPRVSETVLAGLLADCGDDLRAIEGRLYEAFQRAREVGDVVL